MTAPPPRRPWWKRKRTWAALALWLVLAYPLSTGPLMYGMARGWGCGGLFVVAHRPLRALSDRIGDPVRTAYGRWLRWWFTAARDDPPASD